MKGYILDYTVQTNSGIISGDDNQRYNFRGADWREAEPPRRGMRVDFAGVGDAATEIYAEIGSGRAAGYGGGGRHYYGGAAPAYAKSKIVAGLLAIFLGWLGIHKFYLGYTGPGIILLLCGTIGWITFGILPVIVSIIGLIEGIIYLTKLDDQFDQEYVVQRKSWF